MSRACLLGLDSLLDQLDEADCPWGIVTNKPEHLTHPLLEALGIWHSRSACIGQWRLPFRSQARSRALAAGLRYCGRRTLSSDLRWRC